jgi:putative tricarboxylic transport membrane protein
MTGLDGRVILQRAASYFGWLAGLLILIALIGFIPAIGVFILAYMRFGFGEGWRNAIVGASITTLLCWAVFDRGLNVPWPQAVLGDTVPWLRDATDLM